MYTSKCEDIKFAVDDRGVATVTLNRPDALNALNWDMEKELRDIFEYCNEAEEVRAIVFTGEGKHFCAGGDIKTFKKRIDNGESLPPNGIRYLGQTIRNMRKCMKPIVARINGAATGAGGALTFACDFRVGDEKTKIGAGFTTMGFSGDTNGVYTLTRIIPAQRAAQFYMLAQTLTAPEAKELGILTAVAEEGKLDEEVDALVTKLLALPTKAIGLQKKMLYFTNYKELELMQEFEENFMPYCSQTDDHREAVNAFLEKRAPQFTGK